MLNRFIFFIYKNFPSQFKSRLQKLQLINVIKRFFLGNKGFYEVTSKITHSYQGYIVSFFFTGAIKDVKKAKAIGIETTLLKNSIKLCSKLKPFHDNNLVVIDIGANFGFLSLVWAHSICKNNGRVIAFEPNLAVYKTFLKSLSKNKTDSIISLEHNAVGSEDKIIQLYLNNTTSNALKTDFSKEPVAIEMVTMDAYVQNNDLKKCDLIKIDVDGIELEILKGSIQTIEKFKPIFIVETNDDIKIIEFFTRRNYKILDMKLKEYIQGDTLPLNIFCIPQD